MFRAPFVDFRAIKAAVSMERILSHYGLIETLHGSGETRRGPCPLHQGTNKNQFSVNLAKNIWNCFSECKCGGNVLDFVAKRENVDVHRAAILLCEWFNLRQDVSDESHNLSQRRAASTSSLRNENPLSTKENTANKPLGFELKDLDPNHPFLAERGITAELANEFGIGFFPGSKGLMIDRIVIPIHNADGKIVAYAGRFPGEPPNADVPKYKLPPGFRKGLELYNVHRLSAAPRDQPLIIVEGFFDCIRLWQHGARRVVALMGSSLSEEQERLILKHTSFNALVLVALDEDDAGRAARGEIAARIAQSRFVRVHRFEREGEQPANLLREGVEEMLRHGDRTP